MELIEFNTDNNETALRLTQEKAKSLHYVLANMSKHVHADKSQNLRPYIDADQNELNNLAEKIQNTLTKQTGETITLNISKDDFIIIFKSLSHLPDEKTLSHDAKLSDADAIMLSYESSVIMEQVVAA